ncbi:MAG: DMT family transporter [Azonexus sp.]
MAYPLAFQHHRRLAALADGRWCSDATFRTHRGTAVAGSGARLCGTLLVVSARVSGGFGLVGLPEAFGALFGITAGTLYQKRFCPSFDYRTGAIIQFVPAAAVTGLAMLFYEDFRVEWNTQFILALSWLCIILSLGAVGLLNFLIRTGTATNVASLFYLVPPCTAVIAWLAFDEALSGLVMLGMALAVSGVYLSQSEALKR